MKLIYRIYLALLPVVFFSGIAYGLATNEQPIEQAPIASFEKGKVNMYRVIDEETRMVCYPLVGHLHGKTVANFCLPLGDASEIH